jgi:hypothetical protein
VYLPPVARARSRFRRIVGSFLLFLLITALLFVVVEGGASTILFVRGAIDRAPPGVSADYVTRYDDRLGWTYTPGGVSHDVFGPGTRVTINTHGFRGTYDHAPAVAPGKVRIVCSGDSFTFGTDVTDDDTWCHQLTQVDPRIETLNMGQGGYGIDQAYLRFERDARPFQHQVHVFAFITEGFRRMRSNRFGLRGKPTLEIHGEELRVANVPVPPPIGFGRYLLGVSRAAEELRTVALINLVGQRLRGPAAAPQSGVAGESERLRSLSARVFAELDRLNREKQSRVVLVYFPMADDYLRRDSDPWRDHVRRSAATHGIPFIDVVDAFRRMTPQEVEPLYVRPWSGHFSPKGNLFVARLIHEHLRAINLF